MNTQRSINPSHDRGIASLELRALLVSSGFINSFAFPLPGKEVQGTVAHMDDFLEEIDLGGPLNAPAAEKLVAYSRCLVEQVPQFIDGHAHLCLGLSALGDFESAALAGYRKLSEIEAHLPHGGKVSIDYSDAANRPYFRLVDVTVDALLKSGTSEGLSGATFIAGLCLAHNPSDQLGLRERIGREVSRRYPGN
ncbi:hypothetical protein [Ralstonia pseudosolanacearum]|uniref:hypothetical protein n=1 Tax=Ralstonia pseudosolanacearum TaxID=1310165 RepID=UPI003CED2F8C